MAKQDKKRKVSDNKKNTDLSKHKRGANNKQKGQGSGGRPKDRK